MKRNAQKLPYALELQRRKAMQIADEREEAARTVMKLACVALNDTEGLGFTRLNRFAKRTMELTKEYYSDIELGEDRLRRRLESMGFVHCEGTSIMADVDNDGNPVKQKLDKYVIAPNVGFYGGFQYDGKDLFLCDDRETDEGYELHVVQKIENGVLVTDISRVYERKNGRKVREQSHLEVEIAEGQLLVYVQGAGFTIPEYRMCPVDEAIKQYEVLRGGE